MHKLIILIDPLEDWTTFENAWPEFLHRAESMPGLLRESTSRVNLVLLGTGYARMHELFFESLSAVQEAMASEPGKATGRLLQEMTGGKMSLMIAECHEDSIENIQKYWKNVQKSQANA